MSFSKAFWKHTGMVKLSSSELDKLSEAEYKLYMDALRTDKRIMKEMKII